MTEPPPPAPSLRMIPLQRLAMAGKWRTETLHSLPENLLLWFTRGQGRVTVSGRTRGYGAHNAIYIPAGTMHCFDISPQVYGTAVFIPPGAVPELPEASVHLRIRDAIPQGKVTGILENLQAELEGHRTGNIRAAHFHAGLLSVWLERMIEKVDAPEKAPDAGTRLVQRYTELIERDLHSGRGVADYAQDLNVTPTHLSRACNSSCGRAALALLTERIMHEARRLLADTKMPVNLVAQSLGFTSAAYFTRSFQHNTGKTPTGFRGGR